MTKYGLNEQTYIISEGLRAKFGELNASQRARLRRVCQKYDTPQTGVFAAEAIRNAVSIYGFLDLLQEKLDCYGISDSTSEP